jgi:REP element-mobilizing transposase RayT
MKPQPFYNASNLAGVSFALRYIWTGWPSPNESFPGFLDPESLISVDTRWESDGMRRLETDWTEKRIRLLFSVKPGVSPVKFTARVKGRLQHALRENAFPTKFSRKIGFRTVGENRTKQIENYIRSQVEKEGFVDKRFEARLKKYTTVSKEVDLTVPTQTYSGRYWYNLHLVLVNHQRLKFTSDDYFSKLQINVNRIARKRHEKISACSLMPDHLHLALRGNIESSPEEIALSYMNNLSHILGFPIWQPGYYVGTFGEFDLGVIRNSC